MIMFLYGPDTYRSRERLHTLKQAFITKHDPSGINVVRLDGSQLTLEKFNAAVKSRGLLTAKRLVIVERLLTDNRKKTIASEIANFLSGENISEDTILIFWEGNVTGEKATKKRPAKKSAAPKKKKEDTKPLLDILKAQKHAELFPLLPAAQVTGWAAARFKVQGASVEPGALETLVGFVGSDLWQLSNEIDKLAAYTEGRPITTADVKTFVSGAFVETIFALTDAIAEKKRESALRLMHGFIANGEPPLYLLTMLVRQFRILIKVAMVTSAEPNYQTVARRLGLHPFVAQKAVHQAALFDLPHLTALFDQLVALDRRLKTTREDPVLLFDQFIIAACA